MAFAVHHPAEISINLETLLDVELPPDEHWRPLLAAAGEEESFLSRHGVADLRLEDLGASSGCAHRNGIEPGRTSLLREQVIHGVVRIAHVNHSQCIADQGRSDKTCRDAVVRVRHKIDEPPAGALTLRLRLQEIELQGHGVRGL